MSSYRFEVIIEFDFGCEPDEMDGRYLDLSALYCGDKHQSFSLTTVPGSIKEIKK